MHFTDVKTHKARKDHRCEWCSQCIDKGEEYKRYRYYDEAEAATVKLHPECMDALQAEADYSVGTFEWTPGQERPERALHWQTAMEHGDSNKADGTLNAGHRD